ncbi:hypothetical protein CPB83DRAFT_343731 [Crepidotus variabilis]|uniref:Uncharacterized protein n=1 Tax=Crepidotus variabilis TaxID=179855 RepID=A0A9P6JQ84_9AGAR|nr:hypothetical protein CPB83DRAFT_343731 [Crepidotus variabilis]
MIGIAFNLIIIRTSKFLNDPSLSSTCVGTDASGSVPLHVFGRAQESKIVNDRNIAITVTQDLEKVANFTLEKPNTIA